jgi:hypothetical protein
MSLTSVFHVTINSLPVRPVLGWAGGGLIVSPVYQHVCTTTEYSLFQ